MVFVFKMSSSKRPRVDPSEHTWSEYDPNDPDYSDTDSQNPVPIAVELPPADTMGIIFQQEVFQKRFHAIKSKVFLNTKFVDNNVLKSLFVQTEVKKLFKNIGWEKVLESRVHEGFRRPTIEFLSTLRKGAADAYIEFYMYNTYHRLSMEALCSIVHKSSRNNIVAQNQLFPRAFSAATFWLQISNETQFTAGKAKASRIVHPVLKMAHRILACVLFPRESPGTVSTYELQLLWLMTQEGYDKPHFGLWITRNLLSAQKGSTNEIHYGGLISLILNKANIQIPATETKLLGDTTLSISVLMNMQLITPTPDESGYIWLLKEGYGATYPQTPYLAITARTKGLLKIATRISSTNWKPARNTREDTVGEDPQQPTLTPSHHPHASSFDMPGSSNVPSYHAQYMEQFGHIRSDLSAYRTIQDQRWEEQQRWHTYDQEQFAAIHRQLSERPGRADHVAPPAFQGPDPSITSLVNSMFNWGVFDPPR